MSWTHGPAIPSGAAPTAPHRRRVRQAVRRGRGRAHPEGVLLAVAFSVPLSVAALSLPGLLTADGRQAPAGDTSSLRPVRSGAQPGEQGPSVLDPAPPPTLVPPPRPVAVAAPSPTATPAGRGGPMSSSQATSCGSSPRNTASAWAAS